MINLLPPIIKLLRGETFWRATLTSGKTLTEGQPSFDFLRGTRSVDWYLDIVGNGDCRRIENLTLCTPEGDFTLVSLHVPPEPCSFFQFKRGTKQLLTGGNVANAHIVGRVDDKSTGECTAIIWDNQERRVYTHSTNIHRFSAWREGIIPIGALNYVAMGVTL